MMRIFFVFGLVAGLSTCWAGEAKAQGAYTPNGRSWLDTMALSPSTPGHAQSTTLNGTLIAPSAASTLPRSDWARDYYAAQGITWSNGPSFNVQQNGPTTTYTWTRPSYSSGPGQNGGAVSNVANAGSPTFLNPFYIASRPNTYGVGVVRLRTPNNYAPYQYSVVPIPHR